METIECNGQFFKDYLRLLVQSARLKITAYIDLHYLQRYSYELQSIDADKLIFKTSIAELDFKKYAQDLIQAGTVECEIDEARETLSISSVDEFTLDSQLFEDVIFPEMMMRVLESNAYILEPEVSFKQRDILLDLIQDQSVSDSLADYYLTCTQTLNKLEADIFDKEEPYDDYEMDERLYQLWANNKERYIDI